MQDMKDVPFDPIAALLWKGRHNNPSLSVQVTDADLKGFEDCVKYLEVTPQVRVFRPEGRPANPGAPATATRSAIPARPAGPPADYYVIQLVDQDGNAIVPVENNEEDLKKAEQAQKIRRLKESAPQLAAQLQADVQSNAISTATILEACEALKVLSR